MRRRVSPVIALLIAAGIAGACSVTKSSPVAPSTTPTAAAAPQSASSLTLIVQVVTRGAETPIPGASVFENGRLVGSTDASGIVSTTVTPGVEFHITVTASGYDGNGAWGSVSSEERWTFYLEPQS